MEEEEEDDDDLREDDDFENDNASNIANVGSSFPLVVDEKEDVQRTITEIKKQMEIADVGLAILMSESEKLESLAHGMEEERCMAATTHDCDDDDEEDASSSSCSSGEKGEKEYAYGLPEESLEVVEHFLQEETLGCMSTNGKGTIFLSQNGHAAYTSHIPKALRNILQQRQTSLPTPIYVSIGTKARFYVEFEDGKAEWYGPEKLSDCLEVNADLDISSVAFGKLWDTFFVVFSDGSWEYHGKGLPRGLVRLVVEDRRRLSDLATVTLGPRGEWFVVAKNGRSWWGGLSDDLDNVISDVLDEADDEDGKERVVDFIDFGEKDSYFLIYE
mmetsp:Transcript_19199/g.27770  ORF Transcript_19199/g.27770 Transcript_19199/m.27770 type:complete len:330 (+) Transcript_19199:3-992(+)